MISSSPQPLVSISIGEYLFVVVAVGVDTDARLLSVTVVDQTRPLHQLTSLVRISISTSVKYGSNIATG